MSPLKRVLRQFGYRGLLVCSFLVVLAGCVPPTGGNPDNVGNDNGDPTPQPSADALPDFSLPDVNPNSARFAEVVSPRDYLAGVSVWYFGAAT